MKKIATIWYAGGESGPAELLRGRLARIVDTPFFADGLWRNDIVLLTHLPGEGRGYPRIARIVHQQYDATTLVSFRDPGQCWRLCSLLAVTGADTAVVAVPRGGKPGLLAVAYDTPLDPELLAEAVGIRQDEGDGALEVISLHDDDSSSDEDDEDEGRPGDERDEWIDPRKPR